MVLSDLPLARRRLVGKQPLPDDMPDPPVEAPTTTRVYNASRSIAAWMVEAPPHITFNQQTRLMTCAFCKTHRASKYKRFLEEHSKCSADIVPKRVSKADRIASSPNLRVVPGGAFQCITCLRVCDRNVTWFAKQHAQCTQLPFEILLKDAPKHLAAVGGAIHCSHCGGVGKSFLQRFVKNHLHSQ